MPPATGEELPKQLIIELATIDEPELGTRSVLVSPAGKGPIVKDGGPVSTACGTCGALLAEAIHLNQVFNVVLRCPACGSFNESSVYQIAKTGIRFLVDQRATVAEVREVLALLKRGSREDGNPSTIGQSASTSETVRRFADLIPRTRGDYYQLAQLLISVLMLWLALASPQSAQTPPATRPNMPPPPSDGEISRIVAQTLSVLAQEESGIHPKVGRNEPCWCGSGQKFKFCHG